MVQHCAVWAAVSEGSMEERGKLGLSLFNLLRNVVWSRKCHLVVSVRGILHHRSCLQNQVGMVLKQQLRVTHQKMFSICTPHVAAYVCEIKFSDSLCSYTSVFSKEP